METVDASSRNSYFATDPRVRTLASAGIGTFP
jgi:hypothetical protein